MKKSTRKQVIIEFILFLLLILFAGLFLSLISYDPADPGWSQTAWHEPIRNFGGYIGAYVSDILLQFFGFIAFTIPILAIFVCLQLMVYYFQRNKPINYFGVSFRIIGFLAFIFSATGFFSLNIQDLEPYKAGGNLGDIVADSILPIISGAPLSILLLVVCLACFTLLTGVSWLYLLEKLGALVMLLLAPFIWIFKLRSNYRARVARRNEDRIPDILTDSKQQTTDDKQLSMQFGDEQTTHQNITTKPSETVLEKVLQKTENSAISSQEKSKEENTITFVDKEPTIKSSDELLQTIRAKEEKTVIASEPTIKISHKSEAEEILSRMELVIKAMNDRKMLQEPTITHKTEPSITLANNDVSSTSSSIDSSVDSTIKSTTDEPTIPLHSKDFTITDAPSKPLFTEPSFSEPSFTDSSFIEPPFTLMTAKAEPEINLDHMTSDVTRMTPQVETKQPQPFMMDEIDATDVTDAVDVIDKIHTQDTMDDSVDEHITVLHNNEKDDDNLIHPLLRRDDKPITKPTTPLPSLDLLTMPPSQQIAIDHAALNAMSEHIEKSLADYRIKAKVVDYLRGPVITRFELELAPGIKAARISTLDRDLARSLSISSVRVVEVIPGKPYVGLELPNKNRQTVYFREVLDSPQFKDATSPLTVVLGKDIAGQAVVADLAKMPHLLVAGTTGSGKSVGVNAMILSILYKSKPDDVRFIMIDPKMLELSIYEGIPHLLTPVVTDMKDAANALNWCVNEMERRYRLMSALGVRNIAGYNEKIRQAEEMGRPIPDLLWKPTDSMDLEMPTLEKMPYIVVMVDEFADLIMAVGKKIEELIARLAQKARAAGIHLVLATQRPSVDVITGLIKANIPTRIAFTVSSKIDSRTILDQMGAESLLGMGDMLYLAPNSSIPIRVHGAFVRDEEVHAVVQDWKARGTPNYVDNVTVSTEDNDNSRDNGMDEDLDPLFDQVVDFVIETRRASISSVQRKFRIGYNRAARIVEQMEIEGIISAPSHNGNREVLAQPTHGDY